MTTRHENEALGLIGVLKLLEAVLILVVAFGALKLMHHDVAADAEEWIAAMRIDPHNEHIHWFIEQLGFVDDRRLKQISAGSFIYAALRLTEGIGLILRQRWAEYLVVIATGVFVPLEIHEILERTSLLRLAVLAVNLAIMWYLIVTLRRTGKHAHQPQQAIDPGSGDH